MIVIIYCTWSSLSLTLGFDPAPGVTDLLIKVKEWFLINYIVYLHYFSISEIQCTYNLNFHFHIIYIMKTLPVPEHHLTLLNIFKQCRLIPLRTKHFHMILFNMSISGYMPSMKFSKHINEIWFAVLSQTETLGNLNISKFMYIKFVIHVHLPKIDTRYWLPKIDTNPGHLKSWFFVNSPSYRNLTISSCWGVNASAEPLLLDLGYPRFPFTWCWL